ncbi:hypothetical protein [Burkholderia stabilis]|uniref:Uncharacterized protein n=1 Tax=Burkholderia stabilis TaxID=95485 RepID=A0AAJ5T924_9BURK|nr:hypothetical protein [Burkholderia stabilis]VBB17251.1 hypothetical protein BSTAB16_7466 [Burkholderia stabilis]
MIAISNDEAAPSIPVGPRAPSTEALKAMRVRARLMVGVYGGEAIVFVGCAIALALPDILQIARAASLDPAQRMGAVLRSAVILSLALLVASYFAARACTAWTKHSPLTTDGMWELDEILRDSFLQQFTWSTATVNRFRNAVRMMERGFTQHDLELLSDYRNRVISYRSELRDWKFAQEQRTRIYGDERVASAAAKVLTKRSK